MWGGVEEELGFSHNISDERNINTTANTRAGFLLSFIAY
jgi:hypothetical protein